MFNYSKWIQIKSIRQNYPILSALVIWGMLLTVLLNQVKLNTGGEFCYPLDDTFIHLSVAKHLIFDNTWGINAETYSAASSSPLYTVLLATLIKIGFHDVSMPFWLNGFIAALLLIVMNRYLKKYALEPFPIFCILLGTIWLVPLSVIALIGMEHLLHTLFVLLFIQRAVTLLHHPMSWKKTTYAGVMAAIAMLIRIESVFVLAAVGLLFLYHRRYKQACWITLVTLLPLLLSGWLSIQYGGQILPNSILIKGFVDNDTTVIRSILSGALPIQLNFEPYKALFRLLIIGLMVSAFTLLLSDKTSNKQQPKEFAFIWLVTCTLHLLFAKVGWLFRYEAWLVCLGIFIIGILLGQENKWKVKLFLRRKLYANVIALLFVGFTILALFERAKSAITIAPVACRNIYEQQYQMAMFFQKYYDKTAIAANDIGAISYYGNNRIIDFWGLGNNEVAKSRLRNYYSTAFLLELAERKNVKIAVIYESWFPEDLQRHWIKVASWQIYNNVICGDDVVTFYATEPSSAFPLLTNLKQFEKQLPEDVATFYYYR